METILKFLENIGIIGIIISFSAFLIGIKFPDWDFKLKLRHRNILTHSPIIIFFLLSLYNNEESYLFRMFIMGFSCAMGVHLIFDFFPKGWARGALLHIPIVDKELRKNISKALIFISIIICLYIVIKLSSSIEEYIYILMLSLVYILKSTKKEEKLFRPLILFLILFILLGNFKYEKFNKKVYKKINYELKNSSFIDKLSYKII
ncbi:MAG: hypothetical protein Q7K48_00475 [Fusobacterium sp. JB021]|nr:hypothetical protein [Fusobacterium sp. JB021]MDP0506324.1 hypothetical protein [Fusobacterium sp. JB019]